MTFKHGSITTTLIDGGNVRLANTHDSLTIERADLDDAIVSLCALRQLKDPEGYLPFLRTLAPHVTMTPVRVVERCPICGGTTKGGHERDGSDHCWGHHDDEGPNLPEHS